MTDEQILKLDKYKSTGQLAKASALLKEYLELNNSDPEKNAELCHIYIKQSRYYEAYEEAKKLEKILNYKEISFWRVLLSAHLLWIIKFFKNKFLAKILRIIVKKLVAFDPGAEQNFILNDALLWGVYWQDMRKALKMNIFCVLSAEKETDQIRSVAFLCYTMAFMGYSLTGLKGLQRLLNLCETQKDLTSIRDLLTWVGVAYQMGAYPKQCLEIHDRLAREFPEAEPFHQIISFASQLNMTVSEFGPEEVEVALNKCFSISFALQESRNHIQIYGSKAALLGLEEKRDEAISFLERSESAAKRNLNTLDDIIFHRLAAITFLNLQDPTKAKFHIQAASKSMKKYAFVMWYRHELLRLSAIESYQRTSSLWSKLFYSHKFLIRAIFLPNFSLFKKTLRVYFNFLLQENLSYWPSNKEIMYLKTKMRQSNITDRSSLLERVTSLLTKTVLNKESISGEKNPEISDLKSQISQVFSNSHVIISESLNTSLNDVRTNFGLSNSFIHNEESDSIRASCLGDLYFIAVQAPVENNFDEPLAVGVVVPGLEIQSHEIVEMALRVLLTFYIANRLGHKVREERITTQNRIAISNIATQVAHDIRSPLTALETVMHDLTSLTPEQSSLLNLASTRIRSIADELLVQARGEIALELPEVHTEYFPVISAIDEILKEAQVTHPNIQIRFDGIEEKDIVRGERAHFQRLFSNLLNNAVEAQRPNSLANIDVYTRKYKNQIGVYIKDNGRGIPSEIINKVGSVGFSFGKKGGNGLGVSFAKSKMSEWGGNFDLQSKENEGTLVSLLFNVS